MIIDYEEEADLRRMTDILDRVWSNLHARNPSDPQLDGIEFVQRRLHIWGATAEVKQR